MKKAIIFYFSGTGNTWWASRALSAHLGRLDFKTDIISIETEINSITDLINDSDIIFLNYPVFGSDRPEIVKDFINALPSPEEKGKPFGIICTQMFFSGDGAWLEHNIIEEMGYSIKWAVHLLMPNNISIPGFPFSYTNDRAKLDSMLKKADAKLKQLAGKIHNDKPVYQGRSFLSNFMGFMQRGPYRKMYPHLQNDLSIDPDSCTKCGKCITLCPVNNIIFADEETGGWPEFQGHCNLCIRCYSFCPTQAILYRARKFQPKRGTREKPYLGPTGDFNPSVMRKSSTDS